MINIIRLKNGEDIIGRTLEPIQVKNINESFIVYEPLSVIVEQRGGQQGLVMSHWVPISLVKHNEASINPCDVLTVFEPNEEFTEYYTNTVEKLNKLINEKEDVDKLSDNEIMDILESLEDISNQSIH